MNNAPDALEDWSIARVLRRHAETRPQNTFVEMEGESLTYLDAWLDANRVANHLSSLGVSRQDYVAVMLPNSLDFCRAWLGLAVHGAVHVAVNTDYKGSYLAHVLNNSESRFLIVEQEFVERLVEIQDELDFLETIIVRGVGSDSSQHRYTQFDLSGYRDSPEEFDGELPGYRDTACVMYTSGTTGKSKGALMPHGHLYLFGYGAITHMRITGQDVYYIVLPLFHANGLFMQLYATLIAGARAVIKPRFSASEWIHDVVRHGITVTNFLGVVAAFVMNQPESELDRKHSLRIVNLAPISPELEQGIRQRFGIEHVMGVYGMTEVNIPLYGSLESPAAGSCGRVWGEYFELEIADAETDEVLPRGQVGEIVVRPRQPFGFMSGYLKMPEKTVEACRKFWFHTGDAAYMDDEGDVFFVDRIKDCIRRRGENISSFELETTFNNHPAIEDVAVYAVPSEIPGAEDEVMVAVVFNAGQAVPIGQLDEYAAEHLPAFAVPRFYRLMDELPKTPTGKVRKHVLREAGTHSADFDRTRS